MTEQNPEHSSSPAYIPKASTNPAAAGLESSSQSPLGSVGAPQSQEEPVCPRHPDRVSYARCKRCMRPACGACQVQMEVGMLCADCYRELSAAAAATRPALFKPWATYTLIGLNVLVYALQWMIPSFFQNFALNWAYVDYYEGVNGYYRALTSGFMHSQYDYTHILFNMFSLYIFGNALERMLGRWRFVTIYIASILGGSAMVYLLAYTDTVVGASGGIFGLIGSYLVLLVLMKQREQIRSLMGMIGLNVVMGFLMPNISWQGHLGGFIAGVVVTLLVIAPQLIQIQKLKKEHQL